MTRDEMILGIGVALSFIMLCLAHILLLPPYEGFDETTHYSYISILSDQHRIPDFRTTPLDAVVESDRAGLPRPYSPLPPFEVNGGITYNEFFAKDALERETAIRRFWQRPGEAVFYTPGEEINWQGQHPPLYYLFMALPYQLARAWPPGMRLLTLRLASVLIACGSLLFWVKTICLLQSQGARQLMLLAGLTAIFFPSLFYDLARLGNDSLAALVFTAVLYFLLSTYMHRQSRLSDFWGLAITIRLGLLTKLFFVPIMVGTIVYSLWLGLTTTQIGSKALLVRLFVLISIPLLLAGWWFVFFYLHYGMPMGSHEMYLFRQVVSPPGDQLTSDQFLIAMTRAVLGFVATLLWCGTWSWVRPSLYLYACFAPLLVLAAYSLISLAYKNDQTEKAQILIAAVMLLTPLLLGFVYHMYLRVRFTGLGFGTSGHYLFFAWPVIGILFALTFELKRNATLKVIILAAFVLVLFFECTGWWRSALVYGGIVKKEGTIQTGVGFLFPTADNIVLILDRLQAIAFPYWAIILYVSTFFLRLALITWAIFILPPVSWGGTTIDLPNAHTLSSPGAHNTIMS